MNSKFEYDTDYQLARVDAYNVQGQLEAAIEDFATGFYWLIFQKKKNFN